MFSVDGGHSRLDCRRLTPYAGWSGFNLHMELLAWNRSLAVTIAEGIVWHSEGQRWHTTYSRNRTHARSVDVHQQRWRCYGSILERHRLGTWDEEQL